MMGSPLHLIWDLDGTLVDSAPEIISTIEAALKRFGVPARLADSPLRIGPPVRDVIRNSFPSEVLPDTKLDEVVHAFREIYDSSDYERTIPFPGMDELIHNPQFVHHVITNKPAYATNRILDKKGWCGQIIEVLTPDTLLHEDGMPYKKPELFCHCRQEYPSARMIGIGDMAPDALAALAAGMIPVGVLWGTGTREELKSAGCRYLVQDGEELLALLNWLEYE